MAIKDLTPAVITIAVSGLFLVFFILILWNISESDAATTCTTFTENMTLYNNTSVATTHSHFCNTPSVICDEGGVLLDYPTEYTYSSNPGSITLYNNTWNNTDCLVGYKYRNATTTEQDTINEIKAALNDFIGWFTILVLMIVASIIMAVMIKGMSGQGTIR